MKLTCFLAGLWLTILISRGDIASPADLSGYGAPQMGVLLNMQYLPATQAMLVTINNQSDKTIQVYGNSASGESNRVFFGICKLTPDGLKISGARVKDYNPYMGAANQKLDPKQHISFETPLNSEEINELKNKQKFVAVIVFYTPAAPLNLLAWSNILISP